MQLLNLKKTQLGEIIFINLDSKFIIANEGDMISTPPFEIHALRITKKNKFIVFSQGLRGGKDYEKDTFRVNNIIKS